MRLFVALMPPPEAIEDLDTFLEPRRAAGDFRWATPEQFHLTLAFLAKVEDRHLDEFVERHAVRAGERQQVLQRRPHPAVLQPGQRAGRQAGLRGELGQGRASLTEQGPQSRPDPRQHVALGPGHGAMMQFCKIPCKLAPYRRTLVAWLTTGVTWWWSAAVPPD